MYRSNAQHSTSIQAPHNLKHLIYKVLYQDLDLDRSLQDLEGITPRLLKKCYLQYHRNSRQLTEAFNRSKWILTNSPCPFNYAQQNT